MPNVSSLTITGRVQGVFYRVSAQKKARQLGLIGFVQNQPDGGVYIELKASKAKLQEFLDWCRQGPRFARVDDIDVKEIPDFTQDPGNSFVIL